MFANSTHYFWKLIFISWNHLCKSSSCSFTEQVRHHSSFAIHKWWLMIVRNHLCKSSSSSSIETSSSSSIFILHYCQLNRLFLDDHHHQSKSLVQVKFVIVGHHQLNKVHLHYLNEVLHHRHHHFQFSCIHQKNEKCQK